MLKIINDLIESQKLCCIFSNSSETDKFALGYILSKDDDFILMENISPYGQYDGISCILIENIIKIEHETEYAKNMRKVFDYYGNKRLEKIKISSDVILTIFNYINETRKLCFIELCNSDNDDCCGFIKEFDDKTVQIISVKNDGLFDGESIINVGDISYISCDDQENRIVEVLNRINNR